MTLERNMYRIVIGLLIVYILYHQGCVDKPCPEPVTINTVERDTVFRPVVEFVKQYVPKPVSVVRVDTFIEYDKLYIVDPVDTAALLHDYFAHVHYADTAAIKYGKLIVKDTISKNRIVGRSILADLNIPTVKETVTVQPKKKLQLYAGITVVGNQQTFIDGFGGFLTLKTKSDQLYQIGGLLMNNRLNVQASMSFLIKLKK